MRHILTTVLLCVLWVGGATAQQQGEQQEAPSPIIPDDRAVHSERLQPGKVTYEWLLIREDQAPEKVATITDELVRRAFDGTDALLRVITVERPNGRLVDSTFSRVSDLAPLLHRSHQPGRKVTLRFRDASVTGAIQPLEGEPHRIDTTYAQAFFDSGNWDLVVRALPLQEGGHHRLAVYDPDNGGRIGYTVRVEGRVDDDNGRQWKVAADLGQSRATLWIDETTRAVTKLEIDAGPGVTLRQVVRGT